MKRLLYILMFLPLAGFGQITGIEGISGIKGIYEETTADTSYAAYTTTEPCFNFSASNYLIIPDNDSLSFDSTAVFGKPFWISFHAKLDSQNHGLFIKSIEYQSNVANDLLIFDVYDGDGNNVGRRTASIAAYYDAWHHYVFYYNGNGATTGIDIYIDKVAKDVANRATGTFDTIENGASNLWIGKYSTVFAKGQMYDFRMGTGLLTSANIDSLYAHGILNTERILYSCTEGSGTVLHNAMNNKLGLNALLITQNGHEWDSSQTGWHYRYLYGYSEIDTFCFPNTIDKDWYFTRLPVDIFSGQSNCRGMGETANLTGSQLNYLTQKEGVYYYEPTNNYVYSYKSSIARGSTVYFGYGASYADTLADVGLEGFIIRYSSDGTPLASSVADQDWNPYNNELFNTLRTYTLAGLNYVLYHGRIPYVRSFQWTQGEMDATTQSWASAYYTNLVVFTDTINDLLGNINYQITRLSDNLTVTYTDTVRVKQNQFVAAYTNSSIISTDSYTFLDALHYDEPSLIDLGKKMYLNIKNITGLNYLGKIYPSGYTISLYKGNK
jgi:hypothetical protein